jgi:hypothetical protein
VSQFNNAVHESRDRYLDGQQLVRAAIVFREHRVRVLIIGNFMIGDFGISVSMPFGAGRAGGAMSRPAPDVTRMVSTAPGRSIRAIVKAGLRFSAKPVAGACVQRVQGNLRLARSQ